MSTLGRKDVRINLKINPNLREEFQAAAHLRGGSMSGLLHQYIVKVVREEKERDLDAFNGALSFVRSTGVSDPEGMAVYGKGLTGPVGGMGTDEARPQEMEMSPEEFEA